MSLVLCGRDDVLWIFSYVNREIRMTKIKPMLCGAAAVIAVSCVSSAPARAQDSKPSWCGSQASLNLAEQTICSTRSLWIIDNQLTLIYNGAIKDFDAINKAKLEQSEKDWIVQRDACNTNIVCLTNQYQNRIELVRDYDNKGHM